MYTFNGENPFLKAYFAGFGTIKWWNSKLQSNLCFATCNVWEKWSNASAAIAMIKYTSSQFFATKQKQFSDLPN